VDHLLGKGILLLDRWEDKIVVIGVDVGVLVRGVVVVVVVAVQDGIVVHLYWWVDEGLVVSVIAIEVVVVVAVVGIVVAMVVSVEWVVVVAVA
jgi:hypothetical protein